MSRDREILLVSMDSSERGESFSMWKSAHITPHGAAGGVMSAIESVAPEEQFEDATGEPPQAYLSTVLDEIEDRVGGKGMDAQIFEHEFNCNGGDYKVTITRVELED